MLKIVVVGFLYTFLARVTGEPMVKIQVCGDVFDKAVSYSLDKIEESDIKKSMGVIRIYDYSETGWGRGKRRGNPKLRELASSGMQFPNVKSIMLPKDIVEVEIELLETYGDNTQTASGPKKTAQNWMSALISHWKSHKWLSKAVLLYLDMVVKLSFQAKGDKLDIKIQDCEVTLKQAVSNQGDEIEAKLGIQTGTLKVNTCDIARKAIQILNEMWKDSLMIDPSGNQRLIVQSVLQPDTYCLAVLLNLLSGNRVEDSVQKHEYMSGSGISLLLGYFIIMINSENHAKQLNKMLAEKDIKMPPEELNALMHDVHEPDNTVINITMDPPYLNIESSILVITADLQGHAATSDKAAFNSQFAIYFTMKIKIQNNRICFLVTGVEQLEIYSRNANMGTSGELDDSYLQQYIKKLCDSYIIPSINSLNLCTRIPNVISDGQVVVTGETVQVIPQ
ncbi:uncharacterized protein [Hyperolius riggenbachi]|uniref:uncharacterized protein n=1 Tax=Hyperolius riggenbachi TaxID=752182 RepID=UPI0035A30760